MLMRGFILVLAGDNVVTAISGSLRKQGLNTHAFADPVAALENLKTNSKNCALVISDIRMPRMNGFQFVRMARELRPDLKVILMTDFEINISEFDKIHPSMKVYGLIKKPVLMQTLEALIKNSTTATAMKRKNEEIDTSQVVKGTHALDQP
jgi:DNA-binding NtrC family response regulator